MAKKGGLGKWFAEDWVDVKTVNLVDVRRLREASVRIQPVARSRWQEESPRRKLPKRKDRREYLGPQQRQERRERNEGA